MSRCKHNNLGDNLTSPRASPKGFRRVMREIKCKVVTHTGMSLSFVEFVGTSPVGLLPILSPSPRISCDLLQKRMKSSEILSPSTQIYSPKERIHASPTPDKGSEQQRSSETEEQPRICRKNSRRAQMWKVSILVAMVLLCFCSMGKVAAMAVTIASFLLLRMASYGDAQTYFHLLRDRFWGKVSMKSSCQKGSLDDVWEGRKIVQETSINESANMEVCSNNSSNRKGSPGSCKFLKKKLRSSFKNLTVQVPRRVLSPSGKTKTEIQQPMNDHQRSSLSSLQKSYHRLSSSPLSSSLNNYHASNSSSLQRSYQRLSSLPLSLDNTQGSIMSSLRSPLNNTQGSNLSMEERSSMTDLQDVRGEEGKICLQPSLSASSMSSFSPTNHSPSTSSLSSSRSPNTLAPNHSLSELAMNHKKWEQPHGLKSSPIATTLALLVALQGLFFGRVVAGIAVFSWLLIWSFVVFVHRLIAPRGSHLHDST